MPTEEKPAYQYQAEISQARDRKSAWDIIQSAPEHMQKRLISHAQTVFAIRMYYKRKKRV